MFRYKKDAEESHEEEAERLSAWEKYLQGEENDNKDKKVEAENQQSKEELAPESTKNDDKKEKSEVAENGNGEQPMES